MSQIVVRPLEDSDIEEIIRIDRLHTGIEKSGHWRGRLRVYTTESENLTEKLSADLCQVAIVNGKLAGFIVGDVQSWQFGIPRCGRIVAIGIHPDHARSGVGSRLIEALIAYFDKLELPQVQCLVNVDDPLDRFFRANKFEPTGWVTLERRLSRSRT